ncbi:MAG: histidinol-phosphate aminotransferase [Acidimicrobiaceae bacterium]|jgi:histidinol-phosphate/aromatic aminotransferase/cobyric acid decarboxylase-like protein|nr:histidinol-phosphate aminotransferase [Acidimicrobiaceae bacterium]
MTVALLKTDLVKTAPSANAHLSSSPVPAPGPHGDDARRLAVALGVDVASILDLAASMNPFAPSVASLAAPHLAELTRYPAEAAVRAATESLAGALGVESDRLLLTNGGSEAIALVAAELGRGWVDEPDFSLYRRHLSDLDPAAARFRSDPHNPTGELAGPGERADVWDEAFYPLATGRWTRGDTAQGESTVVGSLTKVFACPGLRLGYVLAPAGNVDIVCRLASRQPRWSVNALALAVLPDLLATSDLPGWAESIAGARQDLTDLVSAHGLRPRPSAANFILVDGAAGLRERLATRGVLVRDCTTFGLPDAVRIAVPAPLGLRRLSHALGEVVA